MLRAFFLYLSTHPGMQRRVTRMRMTRSLVRRFIAGETLDEALQAIQQLNKDGIRASLNVLGENVTTHDEADAALQEYQREIEAINQRQLDANISIKLTQLGLDLDFERCYERVVKLVEQAGQAGFDVEVDMENSAYTDMTLNLVHRIRDHYSNIGVAVQAYLYRSESDIEDLMKRDIKIRLVKGAYKEPPDRAFPRKRQVDENYARLLKRLIERAPRLAIATHDIRLIDRARTWLRETDRDPASYEFQMIYGIRRDLQALLVGEGWPLRVYVPYGTHWYPYFMRRLAERPANVFFLLRHLFRS